MERFSAAPCAVNVIYDYERHYGGGICSQFYGKQTWPVWAKGKFWKRASIYARQKNGIRFVSSNVVYAVVISYYYIDV